MPEGLRLALISFASVYGALLAVYFAVGWLIYSNDPARRDKIQPGRAMSPAMVRREMRQSVVSLASIAALFAGGDWLHRVAGLGFQPPELTIWSAIWTFAVSLVAFDTWFYWMHRLLHWKPLYRVAHKWHHLAITPVVWSNNSDTLLDNLFLQSYWLVAHLRFPVSPAILAAHKLYDQITGMIGHSGIEYGGTLCRPPSLLISVTHHDQHHRYFQCNYATHFTLWDRLLGTLHDGHDAEVVRNLARHDAGP